MSAAASSLDEELCCSVCSDLFKDPVVLKCSHSFCRVCLQKCWEGKSSQQCPFCRRKSSVTDPPLNLILKNIVDAHQKQKSESRCSLHGEKLLLFCEDDEELLCVVCQTSRKHRNHQLCPVEETVQDNKEDLRASLIPLKEKLEKFTKMKQEFEERAKHMKSQSQQTEKKIKEEFHELHEFLREEEEIRLAILRVEKMEKSERMNEKIENISKQVSTLSEKIRDIEEAMGAEDISFLMTFKETKEKAQCSLQDPELESGVLIDVAKHLGSLKFRVCENMLGTLQYTPVTLDPNTAAPWLSVSDDLTSVRNTDVYQQLPDNPERFSCCVGVLGSEGFNSGKHSWEVEVGDKPEWTAGVAAESVNRKGGIRYKLENGFWVVGLREGDVYTACDSPQTRLRLERKPQRIRVQLDYDRGEVSFFNPADMSLIYTFKGTFTGSLFPFFSPGVNDDGSNPEVLQIFPVKVSVTVM
uniref:Tripartite motif containing 35-12 n=1 Tax=Paramormyrops kingsleyae TaxID=1676925 RepID=A0A3B3SG09_9TELE